MYDPTVPLSRTELIRRQQRLQTAQDRCTGHCCRAFFGIDREDAAQKAERAHRGHDPSVREYEAIAAMVIMIPAEDGEGYHGATCIHYDDATGNCGNYERLPDMCREYPYGKPCEQPACTWLATRPGPVKKDGRTVKLAVFSVCNHAMEVEKYERVAIRGDGLRHATQSTRTSTEATTARFIRAG